MNEEIETLFAEMMKSNKWRTVAYICIQLHTVAYLPMHFCGFVVSGPVRRKNEIDLNFLSHIVCNKSAHICIQLCIVAYSSMHSCVLNMKLYTTLV